MKCLGGPARSNRHADEKLRRRAVFATRLLSFPEGPSSSWREGKALPHPRRRSFSRIGYRRVSVDKPFGVLARKPDFAGSAVRLTHIGLWEALTSGVGCDFSRFSLTRLRRRQSSARLDLGVDSPFRIVGLFFGPTILPLSVMGQRP